MSTRRMVCLCLAAVLAAAPAGAADVGAQKGFGQFGGQGGADRSERWRNNQPVERQRTPYTIRTGWVIPATLLTPINSDLPGQIVGQVSHDVYDTATGYHLLIPQGSRLVGVYSSEVAYGQERVLFAWQRIVFPDGRAHDIGAMPGTDGTGASGVADRVNRHYLRIFGSALLMSVVSAGFKIAVPDEGGDGYQKSRASTASEALAENLGGAAGEMIRKNMSIAPTLEIRPGMRVNVMVTKDLELPEPYIDPVRK